VQHLAKQIPIAQNRDTLRKEHQIIRGKKKKSQRQSSSFPLRATRDNIQQKLHNPMDQKHLIAELKQIFIDNES
jgi:hypothetical protein